MITVYKKNAIPKGMEVVEINDVFFNKITAGLLDERAKNIINTIDDSILIDRFTIQSKFDNTGLNTDKLSTGCKTALNVLYNTDKVFDIKECGDNAIDVIYTLSDGNITCDYPFISFSADKVRTYDDKILEGYDEIKEWWEK